MSSTIISLLTLKNQESADATVNWHFLSHIVIRRTSFPFEWLEELTMPVTAALVTAFVAQHEALDKVIDRLLKHTFPQAVEAARQAGNMQHLRALSKLRHKVGHRKLTLKDLEQFRTTFPYLILTQLEAICRHQQKLDKLYKLAEQAVTDEVAQTSATLRRIANDPFFQEAIFLSNPDLYTNSLQTFLEHPDEAASFAFERKLMAYLQRFCAKNDTASFFGPLNCGRIITDQKMPIHIERQGTKYTRREVFISFWVANLLAELISNMDSIKPFLRPRIHPLCLWEGETVYFPSYSRRLRLGEQQRAILSQVDSTRTVGEIAKAVEQPVDAVIDVVNRLIPVKVLICRLELPSTIFHPFNHLLRLLETLPTEWTDRDYWLNQLQVFETLREKFVEADLSTRQQLLTEMDTHFKKLTGVSPRRNAGETYADRLPIYEDCAGNFKIFQFSKAFFDDFHHRFQPVLDVCAVHATLLQQHYQTLGYQVFKEISSDGSPVPYAAFITAVQQYQQKGNLPVNDMLERLRETLHKLVAQRSQGHIAYLSAGDLEQVLSGVEMVQNCHISPDVMLAAPDFEQLCRGNYQIVLSEVHQVIYVWGSQLYFYPQQKLAEEEMATHIGQMPGYNGLATILNERRHKGLLYKAFPGTWIEVFALPDKDTTQRVPLKFLEVAINGSKLLLRDTRTTQPFCLYTAGDEQLHLWALAVPRAMPILVNLGKHTPRIEIDGVVYQRERWQLTTEELGTDFHRLTPLDLLIRTQKLRKRYGIPPRIFAHIESEAKPYFIDFSNVLCLSLLQQLSSVNKQIVFTEMLPNSEQLWLVEEDGRFCCEFRMTACRY